MNALQVSFHDWSHRMNKKEKKQEGMSFCPSSLYCCSFWRCCIPEHFACQVGLKMTHNVNFWQNKTTKSIFHACLADVHHPQICVAVMVLRTIMSSKPQQTILLVETGLNWSCFKTTRCQFWIVTKLRYPSTPKLLTFCESIPNFCDIFSNIMVWNVSIIKLQS